MLRLLTILFKNKQILSILINIIPTIVSIYDKYKKRKTENDQENAIKKSKEEKNTESLNDELSKSID